MTPSTTAVRRGALALAVGALITLIGGVFTQVVVAGTDVPDDVWSYPWSSDELIFVSIVWTIAHALTIPGLLALRRSGVMGPSGAARNGIALAIVAMCLLMVAELASIPVREDPTDATGPSIVGAVYGLGTLTMGVGLVMAGKATLQARLWSGWRRHVLLAAGVWSLALLGVAATDALALGIAVWSALLLSAAVGLLTQPEPDPSPAGASAVAVA